MEPFPARLAFTGQWYQDEAAITREFLIYFHVPDKQIEIFSKNSKKIFLRKTRIETLSELDFSVGASIDVFGRNIELLDFADEVTRHKLEKLRDKSLLIIKPDAIKYFGKIISSLYSSGFTIKNARMIFMNTDDVTLFAEPNEIDVSQDHLNSSAVIGLELVSDDCFRKLLHLLEFPGPENPEIAKQESPDSLRSIFGTDLIKNAVHCCDNTDKLLINQFFKMEIGVLPSDNTTLVIIKPHAVKEGKVGEILSDILKIFKIAALKTIHLDKLHCEEFYEAYKGVLREYNQMVYQLSSDICWVLGIYSEDPSINAQLEFRNLCGPYDPEIAKKIRPNSLRAKYGANSILNAVHCTDLFEDRKLEMDFIFKI